MIIIKNKSIINPIKITIFVLLVLFTVLTHLGGKIHTESADDYKEMQEKGIEAVENEISERNRMRFEPDFDGEFARMSGPVVSVFSMVVAAIQSILLIGNSKIIHALGFILSILRFFSLNFADHLSDKYDHLPDGYVSFLTPTGYVAFAVGVIVAVMFFILIIAELVEPRIQQNENDR